MSIWISLAQNKRYKCIRHANHPAELQRPMNFEFLSVIAKQLIKKAAISSFGDHHHRHPFQVLLKQNHSNLFWHSSHLTWILSVLDECQMVKDLPGILLFTIKWFDCGRLISPHSSSSHHFSKSVSQSQLVGYSWSIDEVTLQHLPPLNAIVPEEEEERFSGGRWSRIKFDCLLLGQVLGTNAELYSPEIPA